MYNNNNEENNSQFNSSNNFNDNLRTDTSENYNIYQPTNNKGSKKIFIILMVIVLLLVVGFISVKYLFGNKTEGRNQDNNKQVTVVPDDYISIRNIEDYERLINEKYSLEDNYILMNDLDLTEYCKSNICNPIGSDNESGFTGIFNGNNYTIKGYYYEISEKDKSEIGFFSKVLKGSIRNLTLDNAIIKLTPQEQDVEKVGLLVGYTENVLIDNTHVYGSIVSDDLIENKIRSLGLMIGHVGNDGEKEKSYISADLRYEQINTVASTKEVSINVNSHIKNSSAKGNIKILIGEGSVNEVGGFVGTSRGYFGVFKANEVNFFENNGSEVAIDLISHEKSTVFDRSGNTVGGFVGRSSNTALYRNYSLGNINASNNSSVAGFAGVAESTYINECFSTGDVIGNSLTAGFISRSETFGYTHGFGVLNSYSTGNVKMIDSKSMFSSASTFADYSKDYLENVYASGKVSFETNSEKEEIYFVKSTLTGSENSVYYNKDDVDSNTRYKKYEFVGLTTDEMFKKSSYEKFDFDKIWAIDEGVSTPYLQYAKDIIN